MATSIQAELLRLYEQIVQAQSEQNRAIDQQTNILSEQEKTLQEMMEELDVMVNVIRGSADGMSPSLRETLRTLESRLMLMDQDLREKVVNLQASISTVRTTVHELEAKGRDLEVRVKHLEVQDLTTKSKKDKLHDRIVHIIVGTVMLILGLLLSNGFTWLMSVL
jgi:hypothetical protein